MTASVDDNEFGQGSIFNFQVLDADGRPISYSRIEGEAEAAGISLRSGCMCNPGACYDALGLQADEVQMLAGQKEGCGDGLDFVTVMRPAVQGSLLGGCGDEEVPEGLVAQKVPLGSVRASFGWASTFEDAYALVSFLKGYIT
jgi:molybdenum cofactor sulfurtransferase